MKKEEKDSGVYTCISDPISVRRALLGSTKVLIQSLQGYERIKEIRREKNKAVFEFRKIAKEADEMLMKIKKDLPDVNIPPERHVVSAVKKPEVQKHMHVKKAEENKPVGEIDRLERELGDIESKLSGLR